MSGNTPETEKKKSGLALILFGGIFLLAGLGVMVFGPLDTLYQHVRSSDWVQVPATLESVSLDRHRGDNSYTYSVSASYRYSINGHNYYNTRVGYDMGSDNIGDYHDDLVWRLERARDAGRLRVWVNPEDPAESQLVRDLRWKKIGFTLLFGFIFFAVGLGIMLSPHLITRKRTDTGEMIYSNEKNSFWLWTFMAFMFIGISLPPTLMVPAEVAKGNWPILAVLLFPLLGSWMAYMAWKTRRDWKFYGPMPLTLAPSPGQVGGDVGGQVLLSDWYGDGDWKVMLQCVRVRVSSGKNSSRTETVLWQKEQIPHVSAQGLGAVVRFVFTPPEDLPVTDSSGREQVLWRVFLDGPTTPVALKRSYEVPVVAGTGKAEPLPAAHVARSEREALMTAINAAAEQIDVQQTGDGLRLHSRVGRNKAMSVVMTLAGLVFGGAGIGMFIAAMNGEGMLFVMSFLFCLFGIPLFIGGLYVSGRSLDASVSGEQVEMVRYWLGKRLWRRQASLQRADQLMLTSGGSSTGADQRMTEYFHLEVQGSDGRKVRIAEGLAGREVAEAFRDNIIRLLRLA